MSYNIRYRKSNNSLLFYLYYVLYLLFASANRLDYSNFHKIFFYHFNSLQTFVHTKATTILGLDLCHLSGTKKIITKRKSKASFFLSFSSSRQNLHNSLNRLFK